MRRKKRKSRRQFWRDLRRNVKETISFLGGILTIATGISTLLDSCTHEGGTSSNKADIDSPYHELAEDIVVVGASESVFPIRTPIATLERSEPLFHFDGAAMNIPWPTVNSLHTVAKTGVPIFTDEFSTIRCPNSMGRGDRILSPGIVSCALLGGAVIPPALPTTIQIDQDLLWLRQPHEFLGDGPDLPLSTKVNSSTEG